MRSKVADYLPPTMSPTETSQRTDLLEHPDEAFAFYRKEGIGEVVCEQKHMGSRAVVVVCKDEDVSSKRFGVLEPSLGAVYTRTGRRFFQDTALEHAFLVRLRDAASASGLWDELRTDWLCFDCELMPWSAKAQELLQKQYAPVGAAGIATLQAEVDVVRRASCHVSGLEELLRKTEDRLNSVQRYVNEYRRYCWPVKSLEDLKFAPFHLLASEGSVHTEKPHTWHMKTLADLCKQDMGILLATPYRVVELADASSCDAAVAWWTEMTATGREGMVVKPIDFISRGRRGVTQPAMKCRAPEYLRIIYGLNSYCRKTLSGYAPWGWEQSGLLLFVYSLSGFKLWRDSFAENHFERHTNVSSACLRWRVSPSMRDFEERPL